MILSDEVGAKDERFKMIYVFNHLSVYDSI